MLGPYGWLSSNPVAARGRIQYCVSNACSQYEFKVMAFGLSGTPATFLKAMNTTLAPLLRKCVLFFFYDILIFSRSYEEHLIHVR